MAYHIYILLAYKKYIYYWHIYNIYIWHIWAIGLYVKSQRNMTQKSHNGSMFTWSLIDKDQIF